MKKRLVKLLIGIPASGKTKWTEEFLRKNPDWMKVSRDDFRFMTRNEPVLDFRGENLISDLLISSARKILLAGFNLIIDNTHCRLSYINNTIEKLKDLADIDYRFFDTPIETCLKRDAAREKSVGEKVIRKMQNDLDNMLQVFDFQPIKQQKALSTDYSKLWDKNLPDVIISDVDGTICHMNNKRGPFEWNKVSVDIPDWPMIQILQSWKKHGKEVIIVSGRDASCREETLDWFKRYDVPCDHLFMRPAGDYRKDSIIKREIYENSIFGKFNVVMIYDDRNQVVDTWRELGLKCAQVEKGEF